MIGIRAFSILVVVFLLPGCVGSTKPLLSTDAAVSDGELTGTWLGYDANNKLTKYRVSLSGKTYSLARPDLSSPALPGLIARFRDSSFLVQLKSKPDQYFYGLVSKYPGFVLYSMIPCNEQIAREIHIPANCTLTSADQLDALAARTAELPVLVDQGGELISFVRVDD